MQYHCHSNETSVLNLTRSKISSPIHLVFSSQARGIDIPMLDNVVNYNFPAKPKLFVHRVGRCGWYWSCDSHVTFWYGVPVNDDSSS